MPGKSSKLHILYVTVIAFCIIMLYIQHDHISTTKEELTQSLKEVRNTLEDTKIENDQLVAQIKHLAALKDTADLQEQYDSLNAQFQTLKTENELLKSEVKQLRRPSDAATGENDEDDDYFHPIQELNRRLLEQKTKPKGTTESAENTQSPTTTPGTTEPDVSAPQATEPQATTQTEVNQPQESEPTPIEPEETQPVVSVPEEAEPVATEPEATEPVATEPVATEPEVTEPVATEPEVTEPVVAEPEVTEPVVAEPDVTEPVATEPETTEPSESQQESSPTALTLYKCPTAEMINNHLNLGQFNTDDITWWLDFSFRPLNANEEVKEPTKVLFDGKFVDCYYPVGRIGSEETIPGIWVVFKGSSKDHIFVPSDHWQECDMEGCIKMCLHADNECTFEMKQK